MKMVLTGMLIYIPSASRAGIASLLCMVAVANLNYFRPHKNVVLFWLSQISFLTTGSKYIMALLLSVEMQPEEQGTIGIILIGLDLGFMVASLLSIFIAIWMLHLKLRAIQKKNVGSKNKVMPSPRDKDADMLREWKITKKK